MQKSKSQKPPKDDGVSSETPAFVILPTPEIRLEVYINRQMVQQWVLSYPQPNQRAGIGSNRTHLDVSRALLRFHRWVRSLERQSPRVRRLGCLGVRLWINGGVVAAYCVDESIAFLPSAKGAPTKPKKKPKKGKR